MNLQSINGHLNKEFTAFPDDKYLTYNFFWKNWPGTELRIKSSKLLHSPDNGQTINSIPISKHKQKKILNEM